MNKLSEEYSPYLLQHADNPVDWYPWGDEAFDKARREDKPIFLSIGYSTCHWCHVMEKESFEDSEVAELMNDVFVSIKVDREERPDIDGIYMAVCQMLTGSGGWPLTIIMTPDKKPFFAGTYFPKETRFGRSGMKEIIPRIKEIWINKREEIDKSALDIVNAFNQSSGTPPSEIDKNIFEKAFNEFSRRFDPVSGGFGTAPKFPSPHNIYFLLRYYNRFNDEKALLMAEKTMTEMRKGSIYDHIGFGFHRYSTDREWLLPHFEKMLYDQALLTIAYAELYQITGKNIYGQTAEEILTYVMRDMTSPEGGFYSAEDADSDGEEGKYYLWKKDEIEHLLQEDAEIVSEVLNIKREGNFPAGVSPGNILHLKKSVKQIAVEKGINEKILLVKINSAREKLFEKRLGRIHPYKDDKILTDWNALMISAFAKASRILNNRTFKKTAVKSANFIFNKLRDKDGKLLHRYRNGKAGITANIDDYAFLISALIDLYEATFDIRWLEKAIELNEYFVKHFWDEQNGAFFFTPDYAEKLLIRQKEIYDGAIPSGNSVAILNLLKLGRITGDTDLEEKAFRIVRFFSEQINHTPSAFAGALTGLNFAYGESFEIVIAGNKDDETTREISDYLGRKFFPDKIILLKEPDDKELKHIASFTANHSQINNKTTIYVCRKYSCEQPVTTLDEVKKLLN